MKKVLMVARAFPPFLPVGHSIRVVKFIKYLPSLSWLPVVLTVDDKKEYENNRRVGSEALLAEIQPEVNIYRTNAGEPTLEFLEKERKFGQGNWLTRLLVKVLGSARRWAFRNIVLPDRNIVWLPFALRAGHQIVKNEGIDIIFATCPPYSVSLIGAFLKLLTKKPLIVDFRDDWVDTPWYRSKPAITRAVERKMESWVVKIADKVVVVTDWSKKAFVERYPAQPSDKFVLIPNGCDLEEFKILDSMVKAPRNSKFTIVHAGSLNATQSWSRSPVTFFQALHRIVQQQPELADQLNVLFAGDFPEEFRRVVEELGLSNVTKGVGHLPHKEVLGLTKSADLLLAIGTEGFSSVIPGKIYEYWAVGGPPILLLNCAGAAADFINNHSLGFVVETSDVAGIQKAILTVLRQSKTDNPLRLKNDGIEAYDRRALTHQLAQILSLVASGEKDVVGPNDMIRQSP